MISETTTSASGTSATTAYAYGLERIAAYNENGVTRYVYDGRGSVAQAITAPVTGEAVSSALPDVSVQVQSFSYTAFGEQMGNVKVSGFSYNAEAYDAATGMINLRARQYEPTIGRFEQRDIMRGSKYVPMSLQPYLYTKNNAIMYYDPSGMEEVTILSITRIAEEALEYSNRTDVNDDGKIKKLSEAYSQIAGMIRQDEYIPADLMRMLQEAERALKNVKGKSPQVDYEKYQIHIDACELAMTMIDNGFDEEDAIGRLYMDQHFTRNNEQVDWSTTKFSPGEANENELISPYTMVASAKYMYDMEWKYDPNNEMRPGSVVCDSFLRVIAKLHFSNSGYKYHEKNGNLKSTPNYVYNSSGKLIKMIQKGSIFNNDGTLTENAQKYMTEGTAAVRLDYPNKTNHIGISGYRLTARNGDLILPIYHAANKKDNAKIDYINLTTGRQYFSPQYNKKRKTVERKKTTWNKFTQLTYVKK